MLGTFVTERLLEIPNNVEHVLVLKVCDCCSFIAAWKIKVENKWLIAAAYGVERFFVFF